MSNKITLELDNKTKAGFDALVKDLEKVEKSAEKVEKKTEALNKELASRQAARAAEEIKKFADQVEAAGDGLQEMADKYGITVAQAKKLREEMKARDELNEKKKLAELAEQLDGTAESISKVAKQYNVSREAARAYLSEIDSRAQERAKQDAKELADQLERVAKNSDRAGNAKKMATKQVQARQQSKEDEKTQRMADRMAKKMEWQKKNAFQKTGSIVGKGARGARRGLAFVGQGWTNTKSFMDAVNQASQLAASSIAALADRGVPAFERLSAAGRRMREELMQIGESHAVQELTTQLAESFGPGANSLVSMVAHGTSESLLYVQNFATSTTQEFVKWGVQLGMFSDQYREALDSTVEAEKKAADQRRKVREKENAERRAETERLRKEAEEEFMNPGLKMRLGKQFAQSVDEADSSELQKRIADTKKKMADRKAFLQKDDAQKDVTGDKQLNLMRDQLTAMEAKTLELEEKSRNLELAQQRAAQIEAKIAERKKSLDARGMGHAGDEALDDLLAKRREAEREILENSAGRAKSDEWERQQQRDKQEAQQVERQAENRRKRLEAMGKEADEDEHLNDLLEQRNKLEDDLNSSLEERAKTEAKITAERRARGEKDVRETNGLDDRGDALWRRQVNRKDAEEQDRLARQRAKTEAAQLALRGGGGGVNDSGNTHVEINASSSAIQNNLYPPQPNQQGQGAGQPFVPGSGNGAAANRPGGGFAGGFGGGLGAPPIPSRIAARRQKAMALANSQGDARERNIMPLGVDGQYTATQQAQFQRWRQNRARQLNQSLMGQERADKERQRKAEAEARGRERKRLKQQRESRLPPGSERKIAREHQIRRENRWDEADRTIQRNRMIDDEDFLDPREKNRINRGAVRRQQEDLEKEIQRAKANPIKPTSEDPREIAEVERLNNEYQERLERKKKFLEQRIKDLEREDRGAPAQLQNPDQAPRDNLVGAVNAAGQAVSGAGGFQQSVTGAIDEFARQITQINGFSQSMSARIDAIVAFLQRSGSGPTGGKARQAGSLS